MFVTRIKVKPTEPWKTYFWMAEAERKVILPEKHSEQRFKAMRGAKVHLVMKEKMEKYYVPEGLSSEERSERLFFTPAASCFH